MRSLQWKLSIEVTAFRLDRFTGMYTCTSTGIFYVSLEGWRFLKIINLSTISMTIPNALFHIFHVHNAAFVVLARTCKMYRTFIFNNRASGVLFIVRCLLVGLELMSLKSRIWNQAWGDCKDTWTGLTHNMKPVWNTNRSICSSSSLNVSWQWTNRGKLQVVRGAILQSVVFLRKPFI